MDKTFENAYTDDDDLGRILGRSNTNIYTDRFDDFQKDVKFYVNYFFNLSFSSNAVGLKMSQIMLQKRKKKFHLHAAMIKRVMQKIHIKM